MTPFYTILTNYGKTAIAEALAAQQPLKIPHMAVGDGGGEYYEPTEAQTNLRNERWRGELNDLRADEALQGQVIAEAIIPHGIEGDWTAREIGLFDAKGGLVAVGKYPEAYIPSALSGAKSQVYINIVVRVDNVAAVELVVNHDTVIASKQYVAESLYQFQNLLGEITKTYKTYTEMAQDDSVAVGQLVETQGYYAVNDGGAGVYRITDQHDAYVEFICPMLPNGNIAQLHTDFSVSALTCGVRFNGVGTDENTQRYEAAANYCASRQLLLTYPVGKFVATRDITVRGDIQDVGVQGFNRDQVHSWIHMNGFTLHRIGANVRTEGVVFTSNGRKDTPREKPIIRHIHPSPVYYADVDAYYYNCNILDAFTLVYLVGRGITFTNCNLSIFTYALSLHWQEGHDPAHTDPERTNEQGMRVYVFNGCRFHGAIDGYILENRGFNKNNARGLGLHGCYIDTACGYVLGSMHDFHIDVTHIHASRKLFELADGDELVNGVVNGVIKGRVNPNVANGGGLERIIEQRGDTSRIDGVTINANVERVTQAAYSLSGLVGNLFISGSYRDIGRDNGINGSQNRFIDATRVKQFTGKIALNQGCAEFSQPEFADTYTTLGIPDGVLEVNAFSTNLRGHTANFIRGKNGDISRHTYVGDGTGIRDIELPDDAMYCLLYVMSGSNSGRSGLAMDFRFGGSGDAILQTTKTLRVRGIFNTSNVDYMYIVHY